MALRPMILHKEQNHKDIAEQPAVPDFTASMASVVEPILTADRTKCHRKNGS